MSPQDRATAEALRKRLSERAGSVVIRVIVYGSRVRGTAGPESDLDVLVLVKNKTRELERTLRREVVQFMWDLNFAPVISLHVMDEQEFQRGLELGFSFYRNVREEGVTV